MRRRQPWRHGDGLGLVEAGIRLSDNGGIAVDERMRTSRPGVYATGDVTGRDQFVYMAAYGAKLAAQNAAVEEAHNELDVGSPKVREQS